MSSTPRKFEVHRKPAKEEKTPPNDAKAERNERLRDCRLCKKEHALRKCFQFHKMSVGERWKTVKRLKYCFNCLALSHLKNKCTSRERCTECNGEHHTLLHKHKKPLQLAEREPRTGGSPGASTGARKSHRRRHRKKRVPKDHPKHGSKPSCHQLCTEGSTTSATMTHCCHQHHHTAAPQPQTQHLVGSNPQPATIVINVMSGPRM